MQQASVKDGNVRYTFSRDKEIIPYIDQYWDAITAMPRRVTQSWYTTVQRALTKDVQLFSFEETENGPMFGLVAKELTSIRPEVIVNGKTHTKNLLKGLLDGKNALKYRELKTNKRLLHRARLLYEE